MATTRFDAAEYLAEPEAQAEFLAAALEDGSADEIRAAINTIARARGMSDLAKATGIRREQLYRALGEDGNPEFATILTVLRALGVKLTSAPSKGTPKVAPKRRAAKKAGRRAA
ncbi:putative addiction module antidote protein [Bradyrhizobium sp. 83012]|uniref:Addiction module antidote protein n=1 Tax=Bradyrhizobium aeschynomenes TaxID=2734909 RepID=A0ABX2CGU5_9BRAD|nr:addiction module antidote protein [Bradyrhizobium aeschynomenes]NPU67429.1 putative addiction module antidote protein [Bradyrhizobium aeschynomenes]